MQTDIAFEIDFFGIATAQLGINGIDQVPNFRIICRCFVGNAQSILVDNTIVFVKFTREIYKLGPSRSFWFCLFFRSADTSPLGRSLFLLAALIDSIFFGWSININGENFNIFVTFMTMMYK